MIRLDAWPARAQFRPGERAALRVVAHGDRGARMGILARCSEGGRSRGDTAPREIALDDDGYGELCLSLDLPLTDRERAAYAVEVGVVGGTEEARTTTALDVAPHWSVAPRYGFLCDFPPDEPERETVRRADALARLHLNVVQCYDWMATHHTFLPDADPFVDPLGRRMSHATLRRLVSRCRERGIATLAYGALYGAEREFSDAHESWLLYGPDGSALHLAERFYLQDPSPGSPWREWILGQYEEAVRALAFDGIHIDQYGFPKRALSRATGQWREVDLAQVFPGFVEEACRRVRELAPTSGNIFNCVNAWPLEALRPVQGDAATYIEVWEPHTRYRDLYELARRARSLRPTKPVILAAYLAPFGATSRSAGALTAFRLAFAAISASGATQLIAGEDGAVLTEGYYPRYARLDGPEFGVVRRSYDFLVRNGPILLEMP
ncbi:MAG: glycoside hydrolase family 66 protein, partial [Geminicoccaceae bacterium]